jgi:hypothetical protein
MLLLPSVIGLINLNTSHTLCVRFTASYGIPPLLFWYKKLTYLACDLHLWVTVSSLAAHNSEGIIHAFVWGEPEMVVCVMMPCYVVS